MVISLSYSVSCSRAYLCLPQSRCFSSDEYCTKDLIHPSSGQKNRLLPSSLQRSSSSLLFLLFGASSKTGFWLWQFGKILQHYNSVSVCLAEEDSQLVGGSCSRVQICQSQFHKLFKHANLPWCMQCC